MTRDSSRNFALTGAAGYVAPRHMDAIRKVGGTLLAAIDRSDSVGIMDRHFPRCRFFVDFELFADYVAELQRSTTPISWVSICSPNHLHKPHIAFALRSGADAICEKPLVLDPAEIDELVGLEQLTGRRVNTILQLRLHPSIIALREAIQSDTSGRIYDVDLTYITSRGLWYYTSWKGDVAKSGGIATNIGVHFYDMLSFVFGDLVENVVHHRTMDCAAGYLRYERARVRWFLSINKRDMTADGTAQRCMDVKDVGFFDFSKGFEDLHTSSYENIVEGRGFRLDEVRPSIATVAHIRTAPVTPGVGEAHSMLERVISDKGRYEGGYPV